MQKHIVKLCTKLQLHSFLLLLLCSSQNGLNSCTVYIFCLLYYVLYVLHIDECTLYTGIKTKMQWDFSTFMAVFFHLFHLFESFAGCSSCFSIISFYFIVDVVVVVVVFFFFFFAPHYDFFVSFIDKSIKNSMGTTSVCFCFVTSFTTRSVHYTFYRLGFVVFVYIIFLSVFFRRRRRRRGRSRGRRHRCHHRRSPRCCRCRRRYYCCFRILCIYYSLTTDVTWYFPIFVILLTPLSIWRYIFSSFLFRFVSILYRCHSTSNIYVQIYTQYDEYVHIFIW